MTKKQPTSLSSKIKRPVRMLTSKEKIVSYLLIGMFVFLFLVFFQPFDVNNYDPTETIRQEFIFYMLVIGMYVAVVLILNDTFLFNWIFRKLILRWQLILWLLWTLIFISTMIFLLYNLLGNWHDFTWISWIEFVGNFSVLAIMPLVILFLYARIKHYKELTATMQDYEMDANELITFPSDNQKDVLSLTLESIRYLESQDNYVAIHYVKSGLPTKTLIRLTLKRIDELELHPALVRCHRSFVVNLYHLRHFSGNHQNGHIWLNDIDTPFPVSRTYAPAILEQLQ